MSTADNYLRMLEIDASEVDRYPDVIDRILRHEMFGVLIRRVFVVFGALGCAGYLGYLANRVFADSWLFPIALSAIGLGIIYLGILWQRNEKRLSGRLRGHLPRALQELLATRME